MGKWARKIGNHKNLYILYSECFVSYPYFSLLHNVKLKIIGHFILLLKKNSMEHYLQIYPQRKGFGSIKRSAMHDMNGRVFT